MLVSNSKSYSIDAIKILILGESGVGKTKLAATIGEPTLIISAEAGLLCLADSDIDVIDISRDDKQNPVPTDKRIDRLREAYAYLLTKEARDKYRWIYIDSLTEISQNLVEQLQREFPERKDALVLWGEYAIKQKAIIKLFRDLPYYNVVFTALVTTNQDELNRKYLGVDIAGKIAHRVPALLDIVLYMQAVKQEDGTVKRVLCTLKDDRYIAKDRSGKLNQYEPADLGLIIKKIRGVKDV